jgi:hypothetical protein
MDIPGMNPEEVKLQIAISRWQNLGGTLARLIEIAEGAYASAAGAGQQGRVTQAETARPTPSPSEAGQVLREHQLIAGHNKPPSKADVAAAGRVAKQLAATLMDAIVLSNGKPIGDLRFREIDGAIESEMQASRDLMSKSGDRTRCALVLQRVKGLVANAKPSDKIRDCIGLPLLETTWKETEPASVSSAA